MQANDRRSALMMTATIGPSSRKSLLTLHIGASAGLLGADLVLLALGIWALTGADPRTVFPVAHLIGLWLVMPLALISLTSGLLLATLTGWGLFRHGWVTIKLGLTLVLTAVLILVLLPRLAANAEAAVSPQGIAGDGPVGLGLVLGPAAASAALVLALALAVFKPGSRPHERVGHAVNR
jgi:hypothetical protein